MPLLQKMNPQEYQKLLESSELFQSLDEERKSQVSAATGESMEYFAEIFIRNEKLLTTAKQEYLKRNEEITKNFQQEVRKIAKEKRTQDEEKAIQEDQEKENNLLSQLNSI